MGLARSTRVPLHTRRQVSTLTSVGACLVLTTLWVAELSVSFNPGSEGTMDFERRRATLDSDASGRRLDSVPFEDLILEKPYGTSPNRGWVFLHIIGIGYMLLGLNTICDVYFTGALEVMVEKWHVKPDVAGATFMAAGGSAPELFTSFIGTFVVKNDVGFGTIVGSAVFNVLFVVGVCGFVSSGAIKLTWWPLFRDCTYYLLGLGLLAIFSSDETIVLWEALVLFGAYILYCILMYNNAKLEALTDTEFQTAKKNSSGGMEDLGTFNPVYPQSTPSLNSSGVPAVKVVDAWTTAVISQKVGNVPPGDKRVSFDLSASRETMPEASMAPVTSMRSNQSRNSRNSMSASRSSWPSKTQVRGKVRASYIRGQFLAERHEQRMASLCTNSFGPGQDPPSPPDDPPQAAISEPQEDIPIKVPGTMSSTDLEAAAQDDAAAQPPKAETPQTTDSPDEDDDVDLMQKPEGTVNTILWYLSLPVYIPLNYTVPKPSERWFPLTFVLSLIWIASFNFFLVWWVEILGEVLHIHYIVMSFTLLAAGTSVPDLVSSVAVARNGEGDMAISSSIGSNIFDILVGLPLPWIIKTGIVDGGSTVRILSPFLTFHVLLLLFMVFAVIISIHMMGWKLNKMLGFIMAVLYIIFLAVAISIEVADPPPSALQF